jgi:hypothetical protein
MPQPRPWHRHPTILAGMAGEFPSSAFIGRAVELRRLEAVLDDIGLPYLPVVDALRGSPTTRFTSDQSRSRPCSIANIAAAARVEAPILV